MKIQILFTLSLVGLCVASYGQAENGLKKTHHAPVIASATPVTRAEADATFIKVAGLFKSVMHIPVPVKHLKGDLSAPVTHQEVIAEMIRLYNLAKPTFSITPRFLTVDLPRLRYDDVTEKNNLILLIQRGFVGNYGPLATGAKRTLTVEEFGDSIGFFLARVGDCTHISSSKWTPYLRSGN